MEDLHIWMILAGISAILFLLITKQSRSSKLPPGPWGWPIVGNLFQLKTPAQRTLQQMATKYGPVMFLRLGSYPTLMISSSHHAKQFFKQNDLAFASRMPVMTAEIIAYNFKGLGGSSYGDSWRLSRKICTLQLLSPKRVSSFTSLRESELRLCVQGIYEQAKQGNSAINVREHISKLTCNIMWLIVAGRRYTNEELVAENLTMGKLFDEVLSLSSVASIGDFIPRLKWLDLQGNMRRLKSLHKALDGFLEVVLDDHLNKGSSTIDTKDFVDVLMDIQREGDTSEFDRSNVKALVMDMVVGGSESTATAIEWAMSLLLKNPHTLKRLQEEIDMVIGGNEIVKEEDLHKLKYLQCVVKESLRLYPPFPLGGPHMSMEDATVCGYDVPKGSLLMLNLWAIGRDENVWEDAEEFRPERFIGEESVDILGVGDMMLLPFSTGRRGCPGSNLAIPIILLSIATFVKCFEWRVEGEIDMTEKFGLSIPRKYPLMVVPSMRVPWM